MNIYIVRHGQTDWNINRLIQGQIDIELNEIGKRQSDKLTDVLATYPIEYVLSSDLLRCKYTAEQFKDKTNLMIEYSPLLRERYYGDWEGKNADEFLEFIFRKSIGPDGKYDPGYTPPGVESMTDLWKRCEEIYNKIKLLDKNTLIITHGGTKGMLLSLFSNGTHHSAHSYSFCNTSITELQRYTHPNFLDASKKKHIIFELLRYNCTNHLL